MTQFYDNPIIETLSLKAFAGVSSAAVGQRFVGPPGKTGRILGASVVTTTATTVAASLVRVGTGAAPAAALSLTVPILAINLHHQATQAEVDAGADIAADTLYQIDGDGLATAGAVDVQVIIAWF
jgi:hypothetical protein